MNEIMIKNTAQLLVEKKPWIVLTGAGISTESGIPDFRSPRTGLWEKLDPMEILSVRTLQEDPHTFYRIGLSVLLRFRDAEPNDAHRVLARWEHEGLVEGIITQNIDDLHRQAGSQKVLEIHGHLRTFLCLRCGSDTPTEEVAEKVKSQIPPVCKCGGVLRPRVILFGDMLPPVFQQAEELSHQHPLLVIGSSLQVSPANYLPSQAPTIGIINREPTPFDEKAAFVIHGGAVEILTALNTAFKELGRKQ